MKSLFNGGIRLFATICLFPAASSPGAETWPTKDWTVASPTQSVVKPEALRALYQYAFPTRPSDPADQSGVRTDALIIIKHGLVQAEKYYQDPEPGFGYDRDAKHLIWSATKAFTNALVGVAVQDRRLFMDTPLNNYYPQLNRRGVDMVRVHHALEFSSCLDWTEIYEGDDPYKSSVIAMLYGPEHSDMAAFTARQNFDCQPGHRWRYSSGDTNLLMGALKQVYSRHYADLPWNRLFDRIGMHHVTFERDPSGTFTGSSYIYATARDLAKFGYLFLKDGNWNGDQIIPRGWARYSAAPSPAYAETEIHKQSLEWVGGPNWWSNAAVPSKGFGPTWPAAPADMYVASGHWGQRIWVIPSQDTVIVRLADDRAGETDPGAFDNNTFLNLALKAIEE